MRDEAAHTDKPISEGMTKRAAAAISTFVSGPGAIEGKWLLGMQEQCHVSDSPFAV